MPARTLTSLLQSFQKEQPTATLRRSSRIQSLTQPDYPQGQRAGGGRRSARVQELTERRLRLRSHKEGEKDRAYGNKGIQEHDKRGTKRARTTVAKPAEAESPKVKKKGPRTRKRVAPARRQASSRANPPAATSKGKTIRKAPNKQQQQIGRAQPPPQSDVEYWLNEKMPQKNPQLPKEQPANRQAQKASENPDAPDRQESSNVGAPTATSNRTLKNSNNEFKFYLIARNASTDITTRDWWTRTLQASIRRYNGHQSTIRTVNDVISLAQRFINQNSNLRTTTAPEELDNIVETFHQDLCEKLWESGSYSINKLDFNIDLKESRDRKRNRNETFFQHTIMMHSTDHWRFNETFACTCNQGWHIAAPELPLVKGAQDDENKIGRFRPDLTISFQESAMRGEGSRQVLPFKDDLMSQWAVFPDGGTTQCFPFLIVEAKKGNGDMEKALYTSFYAASRALNNLLLCMRRARKIPEFFEYARTFSINISPNEFEARVHRATWDEDSDEAIFVHEALDTRANYTRNEIAAVIRVIVVEYAQTVLLPLLQPVYKALASTMGRPTEVDGEMIQAWKAFKSKNRDFNEEHLIEKIKKRKADDQLASSPKRSNAGTTFEQSNDRAPSALATGHQSRVDMSFTRETDPMSLAGESQRSIQSEDARIY